MEHIAMLITFPEGTSLEQAQDIYNRMNNKFLVDTQFSTPPQKFNSDYSSPVIYYP